MTGRLQPGDYYRPLLALSIPATTPDPHTPRCRSTEKNSNSNERSFLSCLSCSSQGEYIRSERERSAHGGVVRNRKKRSTISSAGGGSIPIKNQKEWDGQRNKDIPCGRVTEGIEIDPRTRTSPVDHPDEVWLVLAECQVVTSF